MFNSAKDMVRGMFKARGILCAMLLCGLSLLTAGQALAQSFPSRPVTIIVPYGPGSGNDVSARLLAKSISEELGQSVVVDNKPGAGGQIGPTWSPRRRQTATPLAWVPAPSW